MEWTWFQEGGSAARGMKLLKSELNSWNRGRGVVTVALLKEFAFILHVTNGTIRVLSATYLSSCKVFGKRRNGEPSENSSTAEDQLPHHSPLKPTFTAERVDLFN